MHHIVEGSLLSVLSNTWQRCEWESSHYADSSKALTVVRLPLGLVHIARCRHISVQDFTVKSTFHDAVARCKLQTVNLPKSA